MATKQAAAPRMSDAAVEARTGKTWAEWFKILDAGGARKLRHKEIAKYLYQQYKLSGWWSQMVTVTYEQARGLRQKHEKPGGFEISVCRTIDAPVARAFRAWEDVNQRRHWLKDAAFTIRRATPAKTLRITWVDGKTHVEANFSPKGDGKCQVVAQHSRLSDAKHAERMKKYWAVQLGRLKDVLEA
jgi:uncharacterized protein YndB with AHSA1/START domain